MQKPTDLIKRASCTVRAGISRFRDRQDGNATIEIVLWAPFFFILLMIVGQLSLIFFGQSIALSAAQDATRAYSIGELASEAEVRSFVQAELSTMSDRVTVTSTITDGLITTVVNMPAGDVGGPLGFLSQFANLTIQSVAQQYKEV